MYLAILGNLRLWTVITNEISFGKIGQSERARHRYESLIRYKSCHSINVNILIGMFTFFVSDRRDVGDFAGYFLLLCSLSER